MNSNYDNEAEGDLKKPFLHTGSWLLSSAIAIRESQISVVACVLIEALGPIQFGFTAGYSSPTQSAITGDLVSSSLALSNENDSWVLHIEGHSTMFGSVLTYVTLRLIGEGPNDEDGAMKKGRKWILDHGSATVVTSWGKMCLAYLNGQEIIHYHQKYGFHLTFFLFIQFLQVYDALPSEEHFEYQ